MEIKIERKKTKKQNWNTFQRITRARIGKKKEIVRYTRTQWNRPTCGLFVCEPKGKENSRLKRPQTNTNNSNSVHTHTNKQKPKTWLDPLPCVPYSLTYSEHYWQLGKHFLSFLFHLISFHRISSWVLFFLSFSSFAYSFVMNQSRYCFCKFFFPFYCSKYDILWYTLNSTMPNDVGISRIYFLSFISLQLRFVSFRGW